MYGKMKASQLRAILISKHCRVPKNKKSKLCVKHAEIVAKTRKAHKAEKSRKSRRRR